MEEQELHHLFIAIMDYVIDTTKKIQTNTINSVELGLQLENMQGGNDNGRYIIYNFRSSYIVKM